MKTFKFVGNTRKTLEQIKSEDIHSFKLCDPAYDIHGKILPTIFKAIYVSINSNYDEVKENQLRSYRS